MSTPEFEQKKRQSIEKLGGAKRFRESSLQWIVDSTAYDYSYNFTWLGRPIIQYPPDMIALQEIIWKVQPDLIIETGVAHGGSLIFSASILQLLGGDGIVVGVDIEIRPHNRKAIEEHPLARRIQLIEGSSVDKAVVDQVHELARSRKRVMVFLDSNHTHEHVAEELRLYSPLVKKGSYLVVLDTIIEDFPTGAFANRPWDKGNSPKTAVWEFLKTNDRFAIDEDIDRKLIISVAPNGYLQCLKD